MAGPALTGGTSRAGAMTSGLALIRAGTVARALETRAAVTRVSATRVSAVIHAMAAVRVLVVICAGARA